MTKNWIKKSKKALEKLVKKIKNFFKKMLSNSLTVLEILVRFISLVVALVPFAIGFIIYVIKDAFINGKEAAGQLFNK